MAKVRITKKPGTRKVKITGLPSAAYGGTSGSGFYGSQLAPFYSKDFTKGEGDLSTRSTIQSVPRDQANIEAEKGETVLMPNMAGLPAHFDIGGSRHTSGGTPLNVPKDSFVFSDTRKMRIKDPDILAEFGKSKGSWTPAELAKKYNINKYRKILQDPDSDSLDINNAEKMIANYELKLAKLALVQESKKGFPQGIPAVAMPYLATYNLSPDSILPLKAEDQEIQDIPYEDVTNQARYGMQLPKAQFGPPSAGYVDMTNPHTTGAYDEGMRRFDPNLTTYFDTTTEGYQVSKDEQFNPEDKLYEYSKSLQPSVSQEGEMKPSLRMHGEDAANWGIAGMGALSNIFSRDERRNAEDQLARRFKAENIFTSREDRDRGDWTPNQGYFRPDQKSTGRYITGRYGGYLPDYQMAGALSPEDYYAIQQMKTGEQPLPYEIDESNQLSQEDAYRQIQEGQKFENLLPWVLPWGWGVKGAIGTGKVAWDVGKGMVNYAPYVVGALKTLGPRAWDVMKATAPAIYAWAKSPIGREVLARAGVIGGSYYLSPSKEKSLISSKKSTVPADGAPILPIGLIDTLNKAPVKKGAIEEINLDDFELD